MGGQPLSAAPGIGRSGGLSLLAPLYRYARNNDPLAEACNWIALMVASNQPIYPFYVRYAVGGDWQVAWWTLLSTPFFVAVPAIARRDAAWGRAALPLAGIANGVLSAKAFGMASGVEMFLLACGLLGVLGFWPGELRPRAVVAVALAAGVALDRNLGGALGHFTDVQYTHLWRLNAYSVAALCLVILWKLTRVRRLKL